MILPIIIGSISVVLSVAAIVAQIVRTQALTAETAVAND